MCSNKKKYTENQRKAVDNIETAMSVTANAGSGKTKVLVDRYIKILEEKFYDENSNSCDITKILAMTFTNKAAGEMKDRLIEYYNDKIDEINKIKDSKAKEEDIKKYKIISSSLKYANIMTIHTFCNKLLSEYSFEIGMPPEIITLTDFQKNNIEKAAITKSVNNYLKNIENNNQYKEQLLNLYDVNKIKEYIQLLISKRDIWDILENLYSNEENYINKIKEQIKKEFETENIKEILKTFQENLKINLERKINDIKQKANLKEKDIDIIIDEIEKVCEEDLDEDRYSIENIFSKKDKSNIIEFLNKILELCAIKKYGKPATLIKYILKKGKYKLYEIEYKAVDYVDKLIKYIKKYIFEDEDIKNQFNFSKELFELAKKANEYSMEEKRKIGGIDYDDMLLLVRDLLKNSEIAKKVANDYLHILVDEFQDTNNIQYDIIKSIALRDGDDDKNPILFIVGDAKQSIYGFRNADVSLFNKVQEDIKELKQANKEDVNITLEETFRVPYNNSNFINLICNNIFGSLENEYKKLPDLEIKYNDLKVNQKNLDELDNDIDKIISPSGEVVILYTNIEKEDKNKENQSNESSKEEDEVQTVSDNKDEARQIAKYIKKIVKNYKIKDKETYRFIEYKDIGILFPKNKDISNLKDVFYEYNIPFNILKNNDFIQQPEVIDLLNYLKFINLPSNDLALFGVLYSPFFGFTTKELNEIAKILSKIKKETNQTKVSFIKDSLWENLKELNSNNDKYYNIIDNQLLDKIKKAVETLSEMLKIYSTASISHLLRVIIKKFNWNGYFVKNLDKISTIKKIKYNIDLFVAKARSFQETNFITLAEFIKYIESNTDSDFEAYNIEDAVSLLTIHSAKGTEFPVVFLYSINTNFHNPKVPFIDKRYGLTFETKRKNNDENEEYEYNIVTTLARKLEDISSKAEYNRLIYVALTRAKNLLIISIASNIKDDEIKLTGYTKTILETGCELMS